MRSKNNDRQKKDVLGNDIKTSNVVVNSTKLDPEQPIAINYSGNFFTTITGKKYLPFLGDNDNLANLLWEARLLSLTHNSCISSIAETCVGKGLYVTNVEADKVDRDFISFIDKINDEESLNSLVIAGIDAILTDGNAWPEIVKGDIAGTKYVKAHLHTTLECRLAEPKGDTDKPTHVIRSRKFREQRNLIISSRSLKAAQIPIYSNNDLDQNKVWLREKGQEHTILHLRKKYGALPHYGLPQSISSLRQQFLEGKSAQFNLDGFDNQMVLSALLIFKSAMTTQEAQKNAKEIIKTHTGAGKMGRVGVISSEGGIEDFDYQPLETQKEGSYIELGKRLEEQIITAHKWDKVFFANGGEGNLGKGSAYVRAVYDVKKTTVMDPIITYWIDHFIKPLVKIAAEHMGKKEWLKYEFGFKTAMPFSYSSDIDVNKVITKNEGRAILGKENMEGKEWELPINNSNSQKPPADVPAEPA